VDDAVGLIDIGDGNGGPAALFVGEHDLAAHERGGECASGDGLEFGFALIILTSSLLVIFPATTW